MPLKKGSSHKTVSSNIKTKNRLWLSHGKRRVRAIRSAATQNLSSSILLAAEAVA